MALNKDLMGVGMPAAQAEALGVSPAAAVTATGTTTGGAYALNKQQDSYLVTTASSNTGVRLPSDAPLMAPFYVAYAGGGQDIVVYPHTGAAFNGGSADAGRTLSTTTGAGVFMRTGALPWLALVSA